MQIIEPATWEDDVFPCWRRNANNAPRPNSDIWGRLPEGIDWHLATIKPNDIEQLFLIGSSDLKDTFGTYKISQINRPFPTNTDDRHHRISNAMRDALRRGETLDRPICIAESIRSEILIIDGNHRLLAHYLNESLLGTYIYIGIKASLHEEFVWSHPILDERRF